MGSGEGSCLDPNSSSATYASGENPHGRRSSRKPLRRPRPRELRAFFLERLLVTLRECGQQGGCASLSRCPSLPSRKSEPSSRPVTALA